MTRLKCPKIAVRMYFRIISIGDLLFSIDLITFVQYPDVCDRHDYREFIIYFKVMFLVYLMCLPISFCDWKYITVINYLFNCMFSVSFACTCWELIIHQKISQQTRPLFAAASIMVTNVGDSSCWWEVGDRFKMFLTGSMHLKSHTH